MARGREGFVLRDVDGCQLSAGHPLEMQEVERGVDDGDVHGHADGLGFLDTCCGGDFGGMVCQMRRTVDRGHSSNSTQDCVYAGARVF